MTPSLQGQPPWADGNSQQGARAASRGAIPAGSSSLLLLPPSSVGLQKPLRKCRHIHKPPPSSPSPSSKQQGSCPTAQYRSSWAAPSACLLGKIVKRTITVQMEHPLPFSGQQGSSSFFLSSTSAASSSTAFPAPSITFQIAFPLLQGRPCHPFHPHSSIRGSEGQGTLAWLGSEDPQVCGSAKLHVDITQPAPNTHISSSCPQPFPAFSIP